MSARRLRRRRLLLVVTAFSGVVVAHVVDYLVLFPETAERSRHLHATGHGYWPTAAAVGLVAGLAAVVLAAIAGAHRSRRCRCGYRTARLNLWALVGVQMALFSALELSERLIAGLSPSALLAPEFVVGLAAQVAVAAIALLVLRVVDDVAARVVAVLARLRRVATRRLLPAPTRSGWHSPQLASPARPRAPPSLLNI